MSEESKLIENYGRHYDMDVNNENFLKLFKKIKISKEKNDYQNEKFKSYLRAIFFIANLETLCKLPNSLNQIEKFYLYEEDNTTKKNHLNDFICSIKHIYSQIDEAVSKENLKIVSSIIDEYSFSILLFYKFEGLFDYFFQTQINYTNILKEFMWLLFIQCKTQFFGRTRNTLEAIPLMVTIYYLILNDVSEEKLPFAFISEYEKQNISKSSFLLKFLCSKNLLQNSDEILNLKDMIKREFILKSSNLIRNDNNNMFSGLNINNHEELLVNLNIIKNMYAGYLKINFFDERLFLVNNMKDNSPVKLTPFKKQGHHNHYFKVPSIYHRIDFTQFSSNTSQDMVVDNNPTYNSLLNENIKLSSNINFQSMKFNTPVISRNPFTVNEFQGLTPCSKIIQMDNWIHKYIKEMNLNSLDELLILIGKDRNYINNILEGFMNKIDEHLNMCLARIKKNRNEMNNLFLKFLNDILWLDIEYFKVEVACNLLKNNDLLLGIIICTVESILFIENVENVSIFKLIEVVNLDLYDLWKIINPFLRVASIHMPPPIMTHFSEIELQIMSYMIWNNKNKFYKDIEKYLNYNNNGEYKDHFYIPEQELEKHFKILNYEFSNQSLFVFQNVNDLSSDNNNMRVDDSSKSINEYKVFNPIYIFLRRVLHYCLVFIKRFHKNMNLSIEITMKIQNLIKYIVLEETNWFFGRHIDQIILCSCYLIIKKHNSELISFDEIIYKRYKAIKTGLTELEAKSILSRVVSSNKTTESLIEFYNSSFITNKDLLQFVNDEVKPKKKKKILKQVNYATFFLKEDDFILNPSLRIYSPVNRIFNGLENSRLNNSVSPDLRTTPRTNRLKNTIAESVFTEVNIKKDHNEEDYFKSRAQLAKSSLNSAFKETPQLIQKTNSSENKNIQNDKSTPEFIKYK